MIDRQKLKAIDWIRLCLPDQYDILSKEIAPHVLYVNTVRTLVKRVFKPGDTIDAMLVVSKWRSDQHVPINLKKMAVRGVLPVLVKEDMLNRGEFGAYTVR